MLFEELLRDEYNAGITKGQIKSIIMLLDSKFSITSELQSQLEAISDSDVLDNLFKVAVDAASIEEFIEKMNSIIN